MSLKPIRIYQSDRGIWRAEVRCDGVLRWFSLQTRDEAEARRRWEEYTHHIKDGARQLPPETPE